MPALQLPPMDQLSNAAAILAQAAHNAEDKANENAINKAIWQLECGLVVLETVGGFLIPSGTRAGVIHRVSNTQGCNCEAATAGRQCWHQSVIEIIEAAQYISAPPPLASYDQAIAEMAELF